MAPLLPLWSSSNLSPAESMSARRSSADCLPRLSDSSTVINRRSDSIQISCQASWDRGKEFRTGEKWIPVFGAPVTLLLLRTESRIVGDPEQFPSIASALQPETATSPTRRLGLITLGVTAATCPTTGESPSPRRRRHRSRPLSDSKKGWRIR